MKINLARYVDKTELTRLRKSFTTAKQYYGERRRLDSDDSYGVGGSTFRAFRNHRKPSLVYREWAARLIRSEDFRTKVLAVRSAADFEVLHAQFVRSLRVHWRKGCRKEILLAHRYKLVDLLIKWLCSLDFGDQRVNNKLLKFGHVPIDSRVFVALDGIFSGIFGAAGKSMGHVGSESAYRFWQALILSLMKDLGSPPLYFDYFAWNVARGQPDWHGQ